MAKSQKQLVGKPILWLTLAVVISIILHGAAVVDGFGESDAARLAVQALEWHQTGELHGDAYTVRTSPFYLVMSRALIGMGARQSLPAVLNWINVVLAGVFLLPFYWFTTQLAGRSAAAVACLVASATPAHWLAGIYGMPHLPALIFFFTAAGLYLSACRHEKPPLATMALCLLCLVLAFGFKADIVLGSGIFLGLSLLRRRRSTMWLAWALGLPVAAIVVPVVYSGVIAPTIPRFGAASAEWSEKFPFTAAALSDRDNVLVLLRTTGYVLYCALVVTTTLGVTTRRHRGLAVACLLCAVPPALFWGLKMGNSARHMLLPALALIVLGSAVVASNIKAPRTRWVVVLAVLVVNFWVSPRSGSSVLPPSNLVNTTKIVRAYADFRHAGGRAYARANIEFKLYAGSASGPYVSWEILARAKDFRVMREEPRLYEVTEAEGRREVYQMVEIIGPATLPPVEQWFQHTLDANINAYNTSSRAKEIESLEKEMNRAAQERKYFWTD